MMQMGLGGGPDMNAAIAAIGGQPLPGGGSMDASGMGAFMQWLQGGQGATAPPPTGGGTVTATPIFNEPRVNPIDSGPGPTLPPTNYERLPEPRFPGEE
jgi:hypothetical protein